MMARLGLLLLLLPTATTALNNGFTKPALGWSSWYAPSRPRALAKRNSTRHCRPSTRHHPAAHLPGRSPARLLRCGRRYAAPMGSQVTEDFVKASAAALIKSGLAAKGYSYVNVDEGWLKGR